MLLHGILHEMGVDSSLFLGNTILYMYARCGWLQDARYVFGNLSENNLFSWTAMISAYAEHGEVEEAIFLYQRMRELCLMLDKYVFLSILKACVSSRCLVVGMWVHMHVIRDQLEADVFIANMLTDMYAKCWCIDDAQQVFSRLLKPDIISWNTIMTGYLYQGLYEKTLENYFQMQNAGIQPNNVTYMLALKACAGCTSLTNGRKIHVQIRGSCQDPDVTMLNTLMDMYAKGGNLESACSVFDEISRKDISTWNVMISAYVEKGLTIKAVSLFGFMTDNGFKPDEVTLSAILKSSEHWITIEYGHYIHYQLTKVGLEADATAIRALIEMYTKCGSHNDAQNLFERLCDKDLPTWNAMISGYSQRTDLAEKSFALIGQFFLEGNLPDKMLAISILKACLSESDYSKRKHILAMEIPFLFDLSVDNTVLELYVEHSCIEEAYQILTKMHLRDVASWNTLIIGSIQQGFGENAILFFCQMLEDQIKPNYITYSSVLKVCATLAALEWGREIHRLVNINASESSISVGSALVDMYAKCGIINDALLMFDRMEDRQLVAWTAMIGGFALQGLYRESVNLLLRMLDEGLEPDAVTFVAVLSSFSRAGLLQEGCYYFLVMSNMYGEVLKAEHVACMVDLLARAGHLHGANNFLQSMPIEADEVVWMVLLDSCRIHGDVEMARHACKWALIHEPACHQAYVVLSNIYALAGMWDEVSMIREKMKSVII
ncbi:hypothetical protein KP509_10G050400 [Ceratopteris richardii]|nr:hypothetical protein KP509_10G050400 [Ceratopteris richardii]